MSNLKDLFLSITQRIFSNWTALKLALEHGMGSREKAQYFSPYMTELIYMNDELNPVELAAEIQDYMEEEFDTELEDNSPIQIAEELLRFHHYCASGDETTALLELDKLPPLQSWFVSHIPSKETHNYSIQNDNSSKDIKESCDNQMEVVIDEWTTVKTRRKK